MFKKLLSKKKSGFTIIEVVIVLAIAALIIVVVLLAVGALQRSQHTKAAQDAGARLLAQVQNYEADLGGNSSLAIGFTLPATYVTNATLPTGATTTQAVAAGTAASGIGNFVYGPGGCTNGSVTAAASSTQFAVAYYSETAGASVCIHN